MIAHVLHKKTNRIISIIIEVLYQHFWGVNNLNCEYSKGHKAYFLRVSDVSNCLLQIYKEK